MVVVVETDVVGFEWITFCDCCKKKKRSTLGAAEAPHFNRWNTVL